MNNLIIYLIETASVFSVLYLLYILFLSRLTFHNVNRLVLLLLLPVSCVIPFSNHLFPSLASTLIEIPVLEHVALQSIDQQLQSIEQPLVDASFDYSIVLITMYWLVFALYIIRIFMTTRQLFVLRRKSIIQQKQGYQLVISDVSEIFSYFNWVFIPKHKSETFDPQILEHEKAHIDLKHSWDVILTEVYIALFWFNPLLYVYRKSLKSVHEFQADKGVLRTGIKTSQYMQLLMQSIEIKNANSLYNYFNQPILKKRVTMMTKPKSNRFAKLSYLLLVPVGGLLISAFTSAKIVEDPFIDSFDILENVSTTPSLFPIKNATKDHITAFFGEVGKHSKVDDKIIHTGIDIRAKLGTPVLATGDGIIAKASTEDNWGNLIIMTHANGYETWYAHLKGFNTNLSQNVKKGDIIGYVGNTGLSSGPHLHYEIKHNGKHVNPLDVIE